MRWTQVGKNKKDIDNLTQELVYLHGHFFLKWKPIAIEEAIEKFWSKAEQILKRDSIYYLKNK